MSDTATFTAFLKKYDNYEEKLGFQNKVLQQVQQKYVKSSSQPILEEIRYSTPIMKVFKIKQSVNDSQIRSQESYQTLSPLQIPIHKLQGSPQISQKTSNISRKNSQEQSPANSLDIGSSPLHKKYKLIQSYIAHQKQQDKNVQFSQQQSNNNIDSPLNAYYIQPVIRNNRIPYSRQTTTKSQTQLLGISQTQKSIYFNTPKSKNQNDSLQKVKLNSAVQTTPNINEKKIIFQSGRKNLSQTNIEIDNSTKKRQSTKFHQNNTPIKFQYRIRQNASTDSRLDIKGKINSALHTTQLSMMSPENINKLQSNNQAISELIKGSKQILKDINFD